jgi:biopolymer transport protein ExbD
MAAARRRTGEGETGRYVSERKLRAKDRPAAAMQPPLTPLIDVVFQLLLFFLLATTFVKMEGKIQAKLPRLKGTAAVKVMPIKVRLTTVGAERDGVQIAIEGSDESIPDFVKFHAILANERLRYGATSGKVPVIISPERDVAWQHALDAFNQAVRAKFEDVAFARSES